MTTYLNADLHCHSVVSDGTLTPEDLAARAKANGVELWSLTDHDEIGGHAMAAGCTVAEESFDVFEQAFAQVAQEWLDAATLTRRIETDGPLAPEYCRADIVDALHREVWGQGFAPPTFSEEVQIVSQRLVGEAKNHLSLKLIHQGNPVDAIWFGRTEPLPARVLLAFRLDVNEWKGERKVQFLVEGAQL